MQALLTLLINLVPAASVFAFGWNAFTLLLLYWIENLVIGVINVLKILIVALAAGRGVVMLSIAFIPAFIFLYGLFCAAHGLLIWTLFADAAAAAESPDNDLFALPFAVAMRLRTDAFLAANATLLAIYHGFSFLIFWVGRGNWRGSELIPQTVEPFTRLIAVHLTIIAAGIPVAVLGQPAIAVFILAVIKTAVELGFLQASGSPLDFGKNLAERFRNILGRRDGPN